VKQRERRYISYLLRLWQTRDGTRSIWRASIEDPRGGERRGFADLEQLCVFLKQQIVAGGEGGGQPTEQTGTEGDAWEQD
jgi:hypothetical protein